MQTDIDGIAKSIPLASVLEERFCFIEDEILRVNLSIAFQYIIFLLGISKEISGPILYSIYKNIIIYTASIVESSLHYSVDYLIKAGKIKNKDLSSLDWKEVSSKDLYEISATEKVCGIIKRRQIETSGDAKQFIVLNRVAKKSGIFNEVLFKKSEELRSMRNKIHLAGLENKEDYYQKEDVEKFFESAREILNCLEGKLNR